MGDFDVYTNRNGYKECLGAGYKTIRTAKTAALNFFESDFFWRRANNPVAEYWVEGDGNQVGNVYRGG